MSEELRRGILKPIVVSEGKPYTKEEQEKYDSIFEKILKQYGVMAENESIKDWRNTK